LKVRPKHCPETAVKKLPTYVAYQLRRAKFLNFESASSITFPSITQAALATQSAHKLRLILATCIANNSLEIVEVKGNFKAGLIRRNL